MKQRHRALVGLNLALLAGLAAVSLAPGASAQRGDVRRARGVYTMVAGQIQGRTESGIYIVDSNNAELVALRWDNSRKTLAPLGFRDLAVDGRDEASGGRTR